jgi:phosphopantothenoylcysteine decarboxylase/phosphopantothenate--cysteine ligase
MPEAPSILVGVAGGIAAYKAADVVSALRKKGAVTTVLLTRNAARFVAPLTLQALSGRPVGLDLFEEPPAWGIGHISLAKEADAYVLVAATANLLAKLAAGIADDFVTTAALAYHPKSLVIAPAMNTAMWRHPAVRANLETLKARGARIVEPAVGRLACGDEGEGKLADPALIVRAAWELAEGQKAARSAPEGVLKGRRVLVSAGPTREHLDPVRYLSNPSSGKMGYAIAAALRDLGADVDLVSGPTALEAPSGVRCERVTSAEEMLAACRKAFAQADAFVACAAVSDFRPTKPSLHKQKKTGKPEVLRLEATPDILATLAKAKGGRVLVGFAAETDDLLANAGEKLRRKRLDLIVANPVDAGRGFASDDNEAWLLRPGAEAERLPLQPKAALARRIAVEVAALLKGKA